MSNDYNNNLRYLARKTEYKIGKKPFSLHRTAFLPNDDQISLRDQNL